VPFAPESVVGAVVGAVVVATLSAGAGVVACLHPTENDAIAPMTMAVRAAEMRLFIKAPR
jgi:hypothetical protein